MTTFFLEHFWTETKTSLKQVIIDATSLSVTKTSVKRRRVSRKDVRSSSSPRKRIVRGHFWCSQKFLVSKSYAIQGHQIFSKIFCTTVPKVFLGKRFGVSESFWCGKTVHKRRYHNSSCRFFCLTVPEIS